MVIFVFVLFKNRLNQIFNGLYFWAASYYLNINKIYRFTVGFYDNIPFEIE